MVHAVTRWSQPSRTCVNLRHSKARLNEVQRRKVVGAMAVALEAAIRRWPMRRARAATRARCPLPRSVALDHCPSRAKAQVDGEPACRRGSVQPVWAWVTIHLRGLPGERPHRGAGEQPISHAWPCSGWGLPSRTGHPARWCALTAPFHPCLCGHEPAIGGLFSVALSCGSPRLAVSQHPALWSPDLPRPGAGLAGPSRGHPAGSPSPPL